MAEGILNNPMDVYWDKISWKRENPHLIKVWGMEKKKDFIKFRMKSEGKVNYILG